MDRVLLAQQVKPFVRNGVDKRIVGREVDGGERSEMRDDRHAR